MTATLWFQNGRLSESSTNERFDREMSTGVIKLQYPFLGDQTISKCMVIVREFI